MKATSIGKVWIMLVMILMFIPCSNGLGQGSNSDGYGSYDKMGQDPDEILEYGRKMMRYGFNEGAMGGTNKYPGYDRYLGEETVKKLNAEQEAFIKATEVYRQTIYEKELYLKVELSKKEPDNSTALGFQKELSDARGKYDQLMIQHLIRMKKINLDAEKK
jgi:hypothetical protein